MQSIKLDRQRATHAVIKTDVFTPTMLVIDCVMLTSLTLECTILSGPLFERIRD